MSLGTEALKSASIVIATIVCLASLGSCATPPVEKIYSSSESVSSRQECERLGGSWGRVGMLGNLACDLRPTDAGKHCRDNSECQTLCVADETAEAGDLVTGRCYGSSITVGNCIATVSNGRASQTICSD